MNKVHTLRNVLYFAFVTEALSKTPAARTWRVFHADLGILSRGISDLLVDLLDMSQILRQLLEELVVEVERERDREEIYSVKNRCKACVPYGNSTLVTTLWHADVIVLVN